MKRQKKIIFICPQAKACFMIYLKESFKDVIYIQVDLDKELRTLNATKKKVLFYLKLL